MSRRTPTAEARGGCRRACCSCPMGVHRWSWNRSWGQGLDMQAAQGLAKFCESEEREELPNAPQPELVGLAGEQNDTLASHQAHKQTAKAVFDVHLVNAQLVTRFSYSILHRAAGSLPRWNCWSRSLQCFFFKMPLSTKLFRYVFPQTPDLFRTGRGASAALAM